MKELVQKQRNFFQSQATKPIPFRIQQLKKLKRLLTEQEELFFEAIYSDFKKSRFETFVSELGLVYKEIDTAIKNLPRWAAKETVPTNWVNFPSKSYILPEPFGVTLVIGAWNYPYLLSLNPLVNAIAAGNTVILKPSELTVATSQVLYNLIHENFDSSYLAVVQGGVIETTELLAESFDKIFFTGSTKVGKIIYQAAAKNATPVTLELGGKSPAFITPSCSLKRTVQRLIWSKFLNSGQTCIAPDYILVHKSIEDTFLAACQKEIEKNRYAIENDNYVQIINENNFERLQKMIHTDKVFFGGKSDLKARFIEPTILKEITMEDACMQEEIFGPILPVITYETLEEAIAFAKKMPNPLSCYIFSTKRKEQQAVLETFPFGGGSINEAVMHISNPNLPFGGRGASGIGNYHAEAGFKTFSHFKSILHKSNWLELPVKYSPYSSKKLSLIKRFLKL